jgi:predicted ABC-type ATPase
MDSDFGALNVPPLGEAAMSYGPNLVVLAGPNGAGKSTVAPILIRDTLGIHDFVNADDIARGLCAYRPESVAIAAGRLMLARLKELASRRMDFAFETTLASKTFAPWIKELVDSGYQFRLYFVALRDADTAIRRVRDRMSSGGHSVPEETIRRRYESGLKNFFKYYQPLTSQWVVFDNTRKRRRIIAAGRGTTVDRVFDEALWKVVRSVGTKD